MFGSSTNVEMFCAENVTNGGGVVRIEEGAGGRAEVTDK